LTLFFRCRAHAREAWWAIAIQRVSVSRVEAYPSVLPPRPVRTLAVKFATSGAAGPALVGLGFVRCPLRGPVRHQAAQDLSGMRSHTRCALFIGLGVDELTRKPFNGTPGGPRPPNDTSSIEIQGDW